MMRKSNCSNLSTDAQTVHKRCNFRAYRHSIVEVVYVKVSRRNKSVTFATSLEDGVEELAKLVSRAFGLTRAEGPRA